VEELFSLRIVEARWRVEGDLFRWGEDLQARHGNSSNSTTQTIRFEGQQTLQTKAMITLFGLFAEIERDLIAERTKEGLIAAKASGKRLGRPKGALGRSSTSFIRASFSPDQVRAGSPAWARL
jgi:DNA invertase Pin-like site-specific DNA recombinase